MDRKGMDKINHIGILLPVVCQLFPHKYPPVDGRDVVTHDDRGTGISQYFQNRRLDRDVSRMHGHRHT